MQPNINAPVRRHPPVRSRARRGLRAEPVHQRDAAGVADLFHAGLRSGPEQPQRGHAAVPDADRRRLPDALWTARVCAIRHPDPRRGSVRGIAAGAPFRSADACPAGGRPLRAAADPGGRIHPRCRVDGYRLYALRPAVDAGVRAPVLRSASAARRGCLVWRPCSLPRWRSPPSTRRNRASSKRTGWPAMPWPSRPPRCAIAMSYAASAWAT